ASAITRTRNAPAKMQWAGFNRKDRRLFAKFTGEAPRVLGRCELARAKIAPEIRFCHTEARASLPPAIIESRSLWHQGCSLKLVPGRVSPDCTQTIRTESIMLNKLNKRRGGFTLVEIMI